MRSQRKVSTSPGIKADDSYSPKPTYLHLHMSSPCQIPVQDMALDYSDTLLHEEGTSKSNVPSGAPCHWNHSYQRTLSHCSTSPTAMQPHSELSHVNRSTSAKSASLTLGTRKRTLSLCPLTAARPACTVSTIPSVIPCRTCPPGVHPQVRRWRLPITRRPVASP